MWKIIGSFAVSAAGIIIYTKSLRTYETYDNSNGAGIFFGLLLQGIAALVFIWAIRDYFLKDILEELRRLNGLKPGEVRPKE